MDEFQRRRRAAVSSVRQAVQPCGPADRVAAARPASEAAKQAGISPIAGRQGIKAPGSFRAAQRAEQPAAPRQPRAADRGPSGRANATRSRAATRPSRIAPARAGRAPAAAGPTNRRFPAVGPQPSIGSPRGETSGRPGRSTVSRPAAPAATICHATGSPSIETLRMSSPGNAPAEASAPAADARRFADLRSPGAGSRRRFGTTIPDDSSTPKLPRRPAFPWRETRTRGGRPSGNLPRRIITINAPHGLRAVRREQLGQDRFQAAVVDVNGRRAELRHRQVPRWLAASGNEASVSTSGPRRRSRRLTSPRQPKPRGRR